MDLKELELLGDGQDRHWYYASKSCALKRCLGDRPPDRILDVGAGSGYFSKVLLASTTAVSALCVDAGYPRDWSELHQSKPIVFRREGSVGDADFVMMMDVLEHVDDDVGLLRRYADPAGHGTRFVVSVPAFSWLWGPHDEFLGHHRRYTLKGVLRLLSEAGLTPRAGFYFFAAVFPGVAAYRLWRRQWFKRESPRSDLRPHHPLVNRALTSLCLAECALARYNRLFGLTAFGVAEKV